MRHTYQTPRSTPVGQAAQHKPAETPRFFALPNHRFDERLPSGGQGRGPSEGGTDCRRQALCGGRRRVARPSALWGRRGADGPWPGRSTPHRLHGLSRGLARRAAVIRGRARWCGARGVLGYLKARRLHVRHRQLGHGHGVLRVVGRSGDVTCHDDLGRALHTRWALPQSSHPVLLVCMMGQARERCRAHSVRCLRASQSTAVGTLPATRFRPCAGAPPRRRYAADVPPPPRLWPAPPRACMAASWWQAVCSARQLGGQLVTPATPQGRIVLGVVLGGLRPQRLHVFAHTLDCLFPIPGAHGCMPRRVARTFRPLGRHMAQRSRPASPARRSPGTHTSQQAARCSVRQSLMGRESGRSWPTMARNARLRAHAWAILRRAKPPHTEGIPQQTPHHLGANGSAARVSASSGA